MTKTFDCVCAKREGAQRVTTRPEGKPLQELLEYWEKGVEDLKRLQRTLGEAGRCH